MLLFPAIDLFDKKAVRLYKGDYNQMTVYSENPPEIALDFKAQGASCIHVVDLEGARSGETPNFEVIREIKKQADLFTEVGGGIRSFEVIDKYITAGIDRVILGTVAVTNPDFTKEAVSRFGDKIAVGIDLKDGFAAIRGWTEKSALTTDAAMTLMQDIGVSTIICTDISKDGAMKGTNVPLYRSLSEKYSMQFIASGGVSSIDDVKALSELGVYGAIVGKAYYTGAINIAEAIEVAK
ncbi:MAG: 1-(5-phosphoribosyl)-5-[Oscillospiraceae bacterium]|nr:1-(5-phosphoribosyl)-5-[(5-phosphoribosylamino)methylideneamino]imidazole-4-carboxamide isomerase [Oscillospiraceae bacterium]